MVLSTVYWMQSFGVALLVLEKNVSLTRAVENVQVICGGHSVME